MIITDPIANSNHSSNGKHVARKPRRAAKSRITPPSPHVKILVGKQRRYVTMEVIRATAAADAFQQEVRSMGRKAKICFTSSMLDFSDTDRLQILDFLIALRLPFVDDADKPGDILQCAGSFVRFDSSDVERSARGRRMLCEIAALVYPQAITEAASTITQCLKVAGYVGLRAAATSKEIAAIRQRIEQACRQAKQLLVRSLLACLPDAPIVAELVVPPGYEINEAGVCGNDGDVISTPLAIAEFRQNTQTGRETAVLAFKTPSGWKPLPVDRRDIADSRRIIDLAGHGLPVSSVNATTLVAFLAAFEHVNRAAIPRRKESNRLGWQNNYESFLWGNTVITAEGPSTSADCASDHVRFRGRDDGDNQIAAAFHSRGTLEGWFQALAPIMLHRIPAFCVNAGFAAPVAAIFGAPNFAVSLSGRTSIGKTTLLRTIASTWGSPSDHDNSTLVHNWHSTPVFRDRLAAISGNVPTILDETQHAIHDEDVSRFIYGFAQGRGKGRGTIAGIDGQDPIEGILFLSGEQPVSAFSNDGGTRARVLEFWGSPFGESDSARLMVERLTQQLPNHYGHAGPGFVEAVLKSKTHWNEWTKRFQMSLRNYQDRAKANGVAHRMSTMLALVRTVSEWVHEAISTPWHWKDPIELVYDLLTTESTGANVAARALAYVVSWANGHLSEFVRPEERQSVSVQSNRQLAGIWRPGGDLALFPHRLEDSCRWSFSTRVDHSRLARP
ncbi:MAG: DUF927 domain-containing protein [Gemmataceae bacterium]